MGFPRFILKSNVTSPLLRHMCFSFSPEQGQRISLSLHHLASRYTIHGNNNRRVETGLHNRTSAIVRRCYNGEGSWGGSSLLALQVCSVTWCQGPSVCAERSTHLQFSQHLNWWCLYSSQPRWTMWHGPLVDKNHRGQPATSYALKPTVKSSSLGSLSHENVAW